MYVYFQLGNRDEKWLPTLLHQLNSVDVPSSATYKGEKTRVLLLL